MGIAIVIGYIIGYMASLVFLNLVNKYIPNTFLDNGIILIFSFMSWFSILFTIAIICVYFILNLVYKGQVILDKKIGKGKYLNDVEFLKNMEKELSTQGKSLNFYFVEDNIKIIVQIFDVNTPFTTPKQRQYLIAKKYIGNKKKFIGWIYEQIPEEFL